MSSLQAFHNMQSRDSDAAVTPDNFTRVVMLFEDVRLLARRLNYGNSNAGGGVAAGGLGVLRALREHGDQTVPQIGRLRGTSRQNIQIVVNRLAAEGFVEFVRNPAHKRSELVRLTDAGQRAFEAADREEADFVTGLT
jgi:DNA-binding MarR family transcriptional regulator